MRDDQKAWYLLGFLAVFLMLLFPPYCTGDLFSGHRGQHQGIGYGFLFSASADGAIDVVRLAAQLLFASSIAAAMRTVFGRD